jgi:hypothetical protein
MRIFGRSRISKTSAFRATNVATYTTSVTSAAQGSSAMRVEPAAAPEEAPIRALEVTDEMPIVREIDVVESKRPGGDSRLGLGADGASDHDDGESDVFVCRRSSPDYSAEAAAAGVADAAEGVTLFVYGWESVEPGPLSWAFPSLRAALDAVKTMRNAVEWCIVAGSEWATVDAARAEGAVLIEQNA